MDKKKRVVILVVIAIVLALIAVLLQFSDSNEVPTQKPAEKKSSTGSGVVGLVIQQPSGIEDRGNPVGGGK